MVRSNLGKKRKIVIHFNMTKTRYRAVSNGFFQFLEYQCLKERMFLPDRWIWVKVPRPYYSWIHDRYGNSYDVQISSYNENLKEFVKKWPHIDKYLEYFDIEEKRLIAIEEAKKVKIEKKRIEIEYY